MAGKTYRAGIVGLTGIGMRPTAEPPAPMQDEVPMSHAASLALHPRVDLVGVCDLVPALLEEFKTTWGPRWTGANIYTDYREMLAKEDLDILAVVTSDHRHADITVDAAAAGVKGIICEKPLATTLEDADRMIRACEDNGAVLNVDHTRRWRPQLHEVRRELRSGTTGPLRSVIVTHTGPRAMLFRNGTHLIDTVCFLTESEPVQVSARLEDGYEHWDRYRGDGGKLPENEPSASGLVIFANGVRMHYCGSKTMTAAHSFRLLGRDGEISFELDVDGATIITVDPSTGRRVSHTTYPTEYRVQGLLAAYHELIGQIENGGTSVSPAREARKTLQVLLGFLKSQHEGSRLVDVPS